MPSAPMPVAIATATAPVPNEVGGLKIPLVIAVTGHRDLVPAELPGIRDRVRSCLQALRDEYPGRPIRILSALAEGADQLVAAVALDLGLPLTAVLPMPLALYERDFTTAESREALARLLGLATECFELPLQAGSSEADVSVPGAARGRQYAAVGVFLCAHCHILLALWDGKDNGQLGGTSQVVRFHHDDVMPGFAPPTQVSLLSLTDDESDLVYHVVCSRSGPDGTPAPGLHPLQTSWFTKDAEQPRTAQMPARHRRVFAHASEFSREVQRHATRIEAGRCSLLRPAGPEERCDGLEQIDQAFGAADWLAIRYRRRVSGVLHFGHACAWLAAVGYLTYNDLEATPVLIGLILLLMLLMVGINLAATRGAWHRKYLDYRTLAEGLRVQFYWAAAGVTSGNVTKFAHDNCLQMRDAELGWIRNVMRVAGTVCDVAPSLSSAGIRFAQREWIGDPQTGQLGYYQRRAQERTLQIAQTRRIARTGIIVTLLALLALLLVGTWLPEEWQTPIAYGMGIILLLVGVRRSLAQSTAESELIRQYAFMVRIFRNARRRMAAADSDAERRRILKLLGDSALEEHAEWILIHRERAPDEKSALRLG